MGFFERRKARKEQEESERLEWIRSTLDEIEEKLNPENKSGIRYSISVGQTGVFIWDIQLLINREISMGFWKDS